MQTIYLDNAASTTLDADVLASMMPYMTEKFGNPSAAHTLGRETRKAIEAARSAVATLLNCEASEIYFTSGGTESSNTAIRAAVNDLGCTHIITSELEHYATHHTVEEIARSGQAAVSLLKLLPNGHIDLQHLEELLKGSEGKTLVTLMHANNEVGNLLDVQAVSGICEKYGAIFHSDMVQTIGHYPIDLGSLRIHFVSASAHKFHGPKGSGILYVRGDLSIKPLIIGSTQENKLRAGTENLYGIVGTAKALELSMTRFDEDIAHIKGLKQYMADRIQSELPNARFNGDTLGDSLYTVLSVGFPRNEKTDILIPSMDKAGIYVSGGSACHGGSGTSSHVIKALYKDNPVELVCIRFSFCRHNTRKDVDAVIETLKELL